MSVARRKRQGPGGAFEGLADRLGGMLGSRPSTAQLTAVWIDYEVLVPGRDRASDPA